MNELGQEKRQRQQQKMDRKRRKREKEHIQDQVKRTSPVSKYQQSSETPNPHEISRASTASAGAGVEAHRKLLDRFLRTQSSPRSDRLSHTPSYRSSRSPQSAETDALNYRLVQNEGHRSHQQRSRKRKRGATDDSGLTPDSTQETGGTLSVSRAAVSEELGLSPNDAGDHETSDQEQEPITTVPFPTSGQLIRPEIRMLDEAIEAFMARHGLEQAEVNDMIQAKPSVKDSLKRELWKAVSEAIPHRDIAVLRRRARRRYHNYESRAVWSPEDDRALKEAYEQKPQSWVWIGKQIGRMPEDCRDRHRNYLKGGDAWVQRDWTEREEMQLSIAVQECIEAARSQAQDRAKKDNTSFKELDWERKISFTDVSERFGPSRNRLQCYTHWRIMRKREKCNLVSKIKASDPKVNRKFTKATARYGKLDNREKLGLLIQIQKTDALDERRIPWRKVIARDASWSNFDKKQAFENMKSIVESQDTLQETVAALIEYFKNARRDELMTSAIELVDQIMEADLKAYTDANLHKSEDMEVDESTSGDDDDNVESDAAASDHLCSHSRGDSEGNSSNLESKSIDSASDSSGENDQDQQDEGSLDANKGAFTNFQNKTDNHVQRENFVSRVDSDSDGDGDDDNSNIESDSDSDSDRNNELSSSQEASAASHHRAQRVAQSEINHSEKNDGLDQYDSSKIRDSSASDSEDSDEESSSPISRSSASSRLAETMKDHTETVERGDENETDRRTGLPSDTKDATCSVSLPAHTDDTSDSDSDSSASSEESVKQNSKGCGGSKFLENSLTKDKTPETKAKGKSSVNLSGNISSVPMYDRAPSNTNDEHMAQALDKGHVNAERKESSDDNSSSEEPSDNEDDISHDTVQKEVLHEGEVESKVALQAESNRDQEHAGQNGDISGESSDGHKEASGTHGNKFPSERPPLRSGSITEYQKEDVITKILEKRNSNPPSSGLSDDSSGSDAPLPKVPAVNSRPSQANPWDASSDSSSESSDDDSDDLFR